MSLRGVGWFSSVVLTVSLTAPLSGCGGDARTCGAGTVLQNETCVPVEAATAECGLGTALVDGECVRNNELDPPLDCRAGTVLVNGECVANDAGTGDDRCGPGTVLVGNACVLAPDAGPGCVPECLGAECGSDGCGGSCGACANPERPLCDEPTGLCVSICVPQCAGKTCGDNGCGGDCGTCGMDSACSENIGRCIPSSWTCASEYFGGGDVCDCGCGAPDSDCSLNLPLSGCEDLERCNAQGECVAKAPPEWTCSPSVYDARDRCDCGCGAVDPDCAFTNLLGITGCGVGVEACLPDGTCGVCTPDCIDKVCGDDGCGGTCGSCDVSIDETCSQGACVGRCLPTPVVCLTSDCGDDGCGGTCGTCAGGSSCSGGQCVTDEVVQTPFSCSGRCDGVAPSGCYCTQDCADFGNCCADFADFCTCTPDCTGKVCGTDGCGGACGSCDISAPYCTDAGQCTDQCTPQCNGRQCGDDGCGGTCGTCGANESCYWTYQCVPSDWTCDGVLYGDQQGCDCGCGAVDPDCAVPDASVYGCPAQERVCGADGICAVQFCHSNDECGAQWCTGGYAEGAQNFGGYCADPIIGGAPPGFACMIDEECASLLCAGGQCRQHCQVDLNCPAEGTCVGVSRRDLGTNIVQGYVGVCDTIAGTGNPCGDQASCGVSERCIALMDPAAQSARFVCAALFDLNAAGQDCAFDACPAGYRCEDTSAGPVCALPCPGGIADCPAGNTCVDRPLAPLLNTGATVPMCLPE